MEDTLCHLAGDGDVLLRLWKREVELAVAEIGFMSG